MSRSCKLALYVKKVRYPQIAAPSREHGWEPAGPTIFPSVRE